MARSTAIIPTVAPWTNKDSSSTHGSKLYNMYVSKDAAGQFHAVKRPGLDYDAGFNPAGYVNDNIGSGLGVLISYGVSPGSLMYQIWGRTVFLQTGVSTFTSKGLMTPSGYEGKMYHAQLGDYIYIISLDSTPVANSLSRFDYGTALDDIDNGTYAASAGFPTKAGLALAGGLQVLDQYLCCLTVSGRIYNSAAGVGTSWSSIDYVTAEMAVDRAMFLGKHHNHLVVFSDRSTEFFYNADLPTGSPFLRREDVAVSVGGVGVDGFTQHEDLIFFVAQGTSGDRYIAMLKNFQITRISDSDVERRMWFGDATLYAEYFNAACIKIAGKLFYVITGYDNSDGATEITFAYDVELNQWHHWALANGGAIELVASTNGGNHFSQSSILYVQTKNYVYAIDPQFTRDETTNGATDTITCKITLPEWTGEPHEMGRSKFVRQLKLLCDESTDLSDTVLIEVSSDNFATWVSMGSIPRNMLSKITQLGKYYRLAIRLTHAYNSTFRAQALHLEYDAGI